MRETAGEVTAEGDAEAPTTSTGPTSYAVRTSLPFGDVANGC